MISVNLHVQGGADFDVFIVELINYNRYEKKWMVRPQCLFLDNLIGRYSYAYYADYNLCII